MKKAKILLLIATMLSVCFSKTYAATSSIMIDAKSGNVLYEDNADSLRYPASLTKLMTLYLTFTALEKGELRLDDSLKISHTAANRSPSRLGLTPGKTIDVKTAIIATIVKSANDCATVLGESLAKDEKAFAILMTDTAKKLGMKNTTFKNASGLPHSQQKTTARDMAILASALYHHFPQYYSWFSIQSFEYEGKKYVSHNTLLKDFEGADGMKTGYTAAAGFNIVTSAIRDNHRIIAVTMGHDQQNLRDKKVALMMEKALNEIKISNKIDNKKLALALNQDNKKTVSKSSYIPKVKDSKGNWGIQIGAFGSYAKAQNHAQSIKNKLAGKFAFKNINVEKSVSGGKTIYRSQLTGVAKDYAQNACLMLKKNNQSCMVTSFNPNKTYAQK
ncbi:MAG: D-alanyl-D-alanine carboxypeptidase [Alphaproteobacteria bacterium]|nr:D-alanyl-D-alanine carboxypeptidase [Alphaproteobacteria bacterium]MBQ2811145.1 D-alanyl-D-alanine carboxypeptidase [Alphaproteobacteria bacterium]